MAMKDALIAELKMEAASTRKLLEKVPSDNNDWKPHGRSMKLMRLACHVAELAGWPGYIARTGELDFAGGYISPSAADTQELLSIFDKNVAESIASLEECDDERFNELWTMRAGEQVYFTLPKKVAIRSVAMNHHVHHRGQLSVYLRLLDIPIPGMYGPSADEMAAMAAKANAN